MESRRRFASTLVDVNNMGFPFYIPIITMLLGMVYTLMFQRKYGEANELIRQGFGLFSIPFIAIWVLYLFEDNLDSEGKEALLALPYNDFNYGFLRVLKFTCFYVILFYFFYILTATFKGAFKFQPLDFYLPLTSIFFYSALSFLTVMIVGKIIVSVMVIALHISFLYGTRGGFSFYIYPLQWFHPNPYYSSITVAIALMVSTIIMYFIAHWLFTKREFLMRK